MLVAVLLTVCAIGTDPQSPAAMKANCHDEQLARRELSDFACIGESPELQEIGAEWMHFNRGYWLRGMRCVLPGTFRT